MAPGEVRELYDLIRDADRAAQARHVDIVQRLTSLEATRHIAPCKMVMDLAGALNCHEEEHKEFRKLTLRGVASTVVQIVIGVVIGIAVACYGASHAPSSGAPSHQQTPSK